VRISNLVVTDAADSIIYHIYRVHDVCYIPCRLLPINIVTYYCRQNGLGWAGNVDGLDSIVLYTNPYSATTVLTLSSSTDCTAPYV
jgi:hypothetical protein